MNDAEHVGGGIRQRIGRLGLFRTCESTVGTAAEPPGNERELYTLHGRGAVYVGRRADSGLSLWLLRP